MKEYLSLDSLKSKLNKAGFDNLSDLALDAGQAFIYGQATSIFEKGASLPVIQSGIQAGTAVIGAADTAKEILTNKYTPEALQEFASVLVSTAAETITNEVAKLVTTYANNHVKAVAALPGNIAKISASYFNEHKMSVSDALKNLMKDAESRAEDTEKEIEKKTNDDFMAKANEQMNKVSSQIDKYTADFKEKVEKMTDYAAQGPDWVANELNKQINSVVSQAQSFIDSQWEKDKAEYESFAKTHGENIGEHLTGIYNNEVQQVQNKIFNKNKTKLDKIVVKAHKVLQVAKLNIMGKIGVNLPI